MKYFESYILGFFLWHVYAICYKTRMNKDVIQYKCYVYMQKEYKHMKLNCVIDKHQ
jgi:hypothetical protein